MIGNIYDLLTFREDVEISDRDRHGRLPPIKSARAVANIDSVPVVNETLALLIDATAALERGSPPTFQLKGLIEAPALVLSHDCDLIRGDDLVTQGIRVYRAFVPGRHGILPRLRSIKQILMNYRYPYRYFLDDLSEMLIAERRLGFRSILYVLNGTGGRFGARSGLAAVRKLLKRVPKGWEIGIHYNYDTLHHAENFTSQKAELEHLVGGGLTYGRAHYLRFDPLRTPVFLANQGIALDESIGWSGRNGYKAGVAAPFRPVDRESGERVRLIELPLAFMDTNIREDEDGYESFKKFYKHLEKIGGVMSVLFHPGTFANPERAHLNGLYEKILEFARSAQARNLTPSDIVRMSTEENAETKGRNGTDGRMD